MMNFPVQMEEILTFFAVLVRFSILMALVPFMGDRIIPTTVKVLFSLAVTIAMYPSMVRMGLVKPAEAIIWGRTTASIVTMITLEAMVGMVFGFIARLAFDTIQFSGSLINSFIGLSSATMFDPHHENQSMVLTEIQMAFAMLLFLSMDGHHLMISAAFESYGVLGMGRLNFTPAMMHQLIQQTADVIRIGVQISGPISVAIFAVQVAMGVMAKAMPQVNILVLSFSVTIFVGLSVLYFTFSHWVGVSNGLYIKMEDGLQSIMIAMAGR